MATAEMDINKILSELLEKNIEKIFAKSKDFLKDKADKFKVDFDFAFKKYLKNSYDRYSKIKTLIYKTEPHYLYDFFECNALEFGRKRIDASDINNVAKISHFIILEGSGGVGKSTVMKHFFLNELSKKDLIPVFIEFNNINDFNGGLIDFVFSNLQRFGFSLEYKYFEYALSAGCFLFLFDGFDEISISKSKIIFEQLSALSDKYSDNYFIISSRPVDTFISLQRYSVVHCKEFSKNQAVSLIKKIDYSAEIKEKFIKKLDMELYEKHTSFASNPLLLTIMLLTFEDYADIPDKLHIFFSNALETLFFKHDATKSGFKRELLSGLPFDKFKNIFADFCFETYINNKLQFDNGELFSLLKIAMTRMDDYDLSNCSVEGYVDDLIKAVCLICKDGRFYKFTHRSFQEYFTALYIKELDDNAQKRVLSHLLYNDSREADYVFSMLYDMIPDRFEKNIIMLILESMESGVSLSEDKYHLYFKSLVSMVEFQYDSNKNEMSLLFDPSGSASEYILKVTSKYFDIKEMDYTVTNTNRYIEGKLIKILSESDGKGITYYLTDILQDADMYDYIKETWLGRLITQASELLQLMKKKRSKQQQSLNMLLDTNIRAKESLSDKYYSFYWDEEEVDESRFRGVPQPGDIIEVTVTKISPPSFVLVDFVFNNRRYNGSIHISKLSTKYIEDINAFTAVGKSFHAKIVQFNEKHKNWDLTRIEYKQQR